MVYVYKIKYYKNILYYENRRLALDTPIMECVNGIEEYYGKYIIKLKFDMKWTDQQEFYQLIRDIEDNNEKHCHVNNEYKSQISRMENYNVLTLKIPHRYGRHEIEVEGKEYLAITEDIKPGSKIKVNFRVSNIWNMEQDNGKYKSGCVMEVKKITII